jgi:hypothetical protein
LGEVDMARIVSSQCPCCDRKKLDVSGGVNISCWLRHLANIRGCSSKVILEELDSAKREGGLRLYKFWEPAIELLDICRKQTLDLCQEEKQELADSLVKACVKNVIRSSGSASDRLVHEWNMFAQMFSEMLTIFQSTGL